MWVSYPGRDWKNAVRKAKEWLNDQPFSSRPAVHAPFIAATALEDPTLLNNLAFGLANLGERDSAKRVLATVDVDNVDMRSTPALVATLGMICYRRGNIAEGQRLYRRSMELASSKDADGLRARAAKKRQRDAECGIGRVRAACGGNGQPQAAAEFISANASANAGEQGPNNAL
jgi:hypothetical protein